MRQKLLILATIVTSITGLVIYAWIPAGPVEPTEVAVTTLIDDGREIASFASYANLRLRDPEVVDRSIEQIRRGWHPGGMAMLIEAWQFQRSIPESAKILGLLQDMSGQTQDGTFASWQKCRPAFGRSYLAAAQGFWHFQELTVGTAMLRSAWPSHQDASLCGFARWNDQPLPDRVSVDSHKTRTTRSHGHHRSALSPQLRLVRQGLPVSTRR